MTYAEMFRKGNDERIEEWASPFLGAINLAVARIPLIDLSDDRKKDDRQFRLVECDETYGDYPGEVCYESEGGAPFANIWMVGGRVTTVLSGTAVWIWSDDSDASFSNRWRKMWEAIE